MIRIGFIRWLIQVSKTPANNGQTKISLALVPQASRYKSLVPVWHGLRKEIVERETDVSIQSVSSLHDTHGFNGLKQMEESRKLAAELASLAINYSIRVGIVDFEGLNLNAVNFIVKFAILNCVMKDESDPLERIPFVDLCNDMREVRNERDRAKREAQEAQQRRWQQHNAEQAVRRETASGAVKVSMDMLYALLNSSERAEAESKGTVTVKTLSGTFVVPIRAHGLVRQYVDNKYVISHCVVFKDYSIPVGDEALMKIALLKVDPAKFFDTSNKFPEYGVPQKLVA